MTKPKKTKSAKIAKTARAATLKPEDPTVDHYLLRVIGEVVQGLQQSDLAPLGRFDVEGEDFAFEDLDEEVMVTPGVSKAREGLLECGRAVGSLFGIFSREGLRSATDHLRAREMTDADAIIATSSALLGNAARLAYACHALDGLHETFVENVMWERPGPKEAGRRLASVTRLLESLQAGLQDTRGTRTRLPDLAKECLPALKERFGDSMGDLEEGYRWLSSKACKKESADLQKKLNLIVAGAALATGELCRDLLIYIGMLGDMAENCALPWTDLEGAFLWNQPPPEGDGRSPETAYRFHHARNKFEAVGMAHAMLTGVRSWNISSVSEKEILEYAVTEKGKVWISYRIDGRLFSTGSPE